MIIDALVPDPHRRESIKVIVDGQPAWTVPANVIARLGLVAGERAPSGAVDALEAAADEEGALRAALRLLERRSHGIEELRRKLSHKGHGAEAAAGAIARLEELSLLDDVAFATAYATGRAARGRGPQRLRRDLAQLGVDSGAIDRALEQLDADPGVDPWHLALSQAERRAASMSRLPTNTKLRRLAAFFARRGFQDERSREAVRRLAGVG